jgi:hypothetical protein
LSGLQLPLRLRRSILSDLGPAFGVGHGCLEFPQPRCQFVGTGQSEAIG